MTEQSEADKYIKCSKCKCKYINDAEHIKQDFGFNRLEEKIKTCVKCRRKDCEYSKNYQQTHKEEIAERKKDYNKQYNIDNKEKCKEHNKQYKETQKEKLNIAVDENHKCCTRCYKINPITEYGEYLKQVEIEGTHQFHHVMTEHRSCKTCRDKKRMLLRRKVNE